MIRVAVIEDHALVGAAITQALPTFEDLSVVGLATTGDAGVELVARHRPDVALIDLRLGRAWATDHLPALRTASPSTRVLVVTAWASEHGLDLALTAGAHGLLSKDQPLAELADGIRRVHAGELVVSPHLMGALVRRASAPDDRVAPDVRDLEVLRLLAEARTTTDIADELHLSEHAVRGRIRGCMAKLGTHSRLETVAEARRRGWVVPDEPDPLSAPA